MIRPAGPVMIMVAVIILLPLTGCSDPATAPSSAAGRRSDTSTVGPPSPAVTPDTAAPDTSRPEADASVPGGGDEPRGLTAAQRRVDRDDPDQVATAFVVRLEAWDTALDRRPNDAVRRAVAYAGPQLRSRLLAAEPGRHRGHRWNDLLDHHGWTSVTTRLGGLGPAPTGERSAVRAVTCRPVDHGVDGWTAFPGDSGTYIVTLTRAPKRRGWTVVGYTIQ